MKFFKAGVSRSSVYKIILALVLVSFAFTWLVLNRIHSGQLQDDAYISFRYSVNLVRGNGLVFNVGERVEGYTNFLYVLLIAFMYKLGIAPVLAAKMIGVFASIGTIFVTWIIARKVFGHSPVMSSFSGVLLAYSLPFVYWSTAGLATSLFAFLVTLSLGFAALLQTLPQDDDSVKWPLICGVTLVFTSLTRPEGILVFSLVLGYSLLRVYLGVTGFREPLVIFLSFSVIIALYFMWRWSYYGWLLPNTFYAKVGNSMDQIKRGLDYLYEFVNKSGGFVFWGLVATGGGCFALNNLYFRKEPFFLLLWVFLTVYVAYIVYVGGDAFLLYRFFVPILPALFLFLANLLVESRDLLNVGERQKRVLAIFLTVLLAFFQVFLCLDLLPRLRFHGASMQGRVALGRWLKEQADPDATVAAYAIGAIPYYSELKTIDMFGLIDEYIAHKEMDSMGSGRAGQDKYDIDYVLSRQPDYIISGATQQRVVELSRDELIEQTTYSPAHRALFESDEFWISYEFVPIDEKKITWAVFRRKVTD